LNPTQIRKQWSDYTRANKGVASRLTKEFNERVKESSWESANDWLIREMAHRLNLPVDIVTSVFNHPSVD
jgi:formylglycine-generating enzyme required for sulfatase activity